MPSKMRGLHYPTIQICKESMKNGKISFTLSLSGGCHEAAVSAVCMLCSETPQCSYNTCDHRCNHYFHIIHSTVQDARSYLYMMHTRSVHRISFSLLFKQFGVSGGLSSRKDWKKRRETAGLKCGGVCQDKTLMSINSPWAVKGLMHLDSDESLSWLIKRIIIRF